MPGPGVTGEYLGMSSGVVGVGVSQLMWGDMGLSRGIFISRLA
jgi:hypothetical protein